MGLSRLGTFALVVALGLAIYGVVASVLGARRRDPLLAESARTTSFSLLALVAAANGAMLAAILTNDFAIRYVAENSSRATPTFFKVLSLWSADEGSLLLLEFVASEVAEMPMLIVGLARGDTPRLDELARLATRTIQLGS